ncbi:MAG: ABC transporter permease subunit [Bradyrhizobium sp.]|uniref:ABC transporter permease n=1 Tax=Bradyrhizobium sp. TaxID=376 RepID=UPI001E043810|nr:ABC transporter permease subunit [Bradyrhizobium sp.]MBV9563758.1 ABC transporter permease subunit [Bradyrhizobium sp.]
MTTILPFTISPGNFVAPAASWLNTNFHPLFAAITSVADAILNAVLAVLTALPPLWMIAVVAVLAWLVANWRVSLLAIFSLGFCWAMGLWNAAMQTVDLVIVAVVIAVAIAFPMGIWASRDKRVERTLRPVLDVMQTVPPWVYLIPAVIIFSLGRVPALIATVVYGAPPMLRLTTLALNQVPKPFLELGDALGSARSTTLWKIELPLAKPTLLVGLNQCILLSLAMVVLAGLVGAGGLGSEVTRGLSRMEMGVGLRAGLSIVAIALLLDRLSRAALDRPRRPAG